MIIIIINFLTDINAQVSTFNITPKMDINVHVTHVTSKFFNFKSEIFRQKNIHLFFNCYFSF